MQEILLPILASNEAEAALEDDLFDATSPLGCSESTS